MTIIPTNAIAIYIIVYGKFSVTDDFSKSVLLTNREVVSIRVPSFELCTDVVSMLAASAKMQQRN